MSLAVFCSIYKYVFPRLVAHAVWVSKSKHYVDMFSVLQLIEVFQVNLELSFQLHNTSMLSTADYLKYTVEPVMADHDGILDHQGLPIHKL